MGKNSKAMKKDEKALIIVDILEKEYPEARCSLASVNAFQLLVATRLSAQCTDERVNQVTPALFEKYPDAASLARADLSDVETMIHSCGLYKTKARDLVRMSAMLIDQFGGVVPGSIGELLLLPGVGRKTANLIVGDVFGQPSIVTDTHCIRLSNRLGLADSKDPYKVEMELREIIPPEKSGLFCHRLVWHGRAVCHSRNPNCSACALKEYCTYQAD